METPRKPRSRKRLAHLTEIHHQNREYIVTYDPQFREVKFRRKHTSKIHVVSLETVFDIAVGQYQLPLQ